VERRPGSGKHSVSREVKPFSPLTMVRIETAISAAKCLKSKYLALIKVRDGFMNSRSNVNQQQPFDFERWWRDLLLQSIDTSTSKRKVDAEILAEIVKGWSSTELEKR
jgi:hypothetical protein